ncbi:hypothetical protein ZIOFF_074302 (mitochondrion) [Zingiber officinale]|uniref:ATP synthase protein MI25 n=1 Tax=Zingiber officinale TaxID=94328 RepID=A0A8J5ENK8_ZINOF|nr:hypothetical protein ZIOFF_074302 [Zingiber officinale]
MARCTPKCEKTVQAFLCRNLNVKSATLPNATSSRRIRLQDDLVTGLNFSVRERFVPGTTLKASIAIVELIREGLGVFKMKSRSNTKTTSFSGSAAIEERSGISCPTTDIPTRLIVEEGRECAGALGQKLRVSPSGSDLALSNDVDPRPSLAACEEVYVGPMRSHYNVLFFTVKTSILKHGRWSDEQNVRETKRGRRGRKCFQSIEAEKTAFTRRHSPRPLSAISTSPSARPFFDGLGKELHHSWSSYSDLASGLPLVGLAGLLSFSDFFRLLEV